MDFIPRVVSACWVSAIVACGPMTPEPAATEAQPPAQTASAAGGTLACMQVMECFTKCTDDACVAGCRAGGSPSAEPRVAALLDCSENVCQNDVNCTGTSCAAQIDACRADSAVAAAPPAEQPASAPTGARQPHPNANILPWMTGEWIGTNHQFTFHADGRVRRASGVPLYTDKGRYACVSLINDEGTVRQEGDLLIMTFATTDTNHCGTKESVAPVVVRYQIEWQDNHYDQDPDLQLGLRDIDCTKGHDLYCVDRLTRRR